jgi:hypothetical protein
MERVTGYILFTIILISFQLPNAAAEEYRPDELELAPLGAELECSWSKMNAQEYSECQKKRDFFKKMPENERKEWNAKVEKRILEQRMRRLERRVY